MNGTAKKLVATHRATEEELFSLLTDPSEELRRYLQEEALALKRKVYGDDVYIRGLVEFTNYCKNDCYYCGIRCSNRQAQRYRLTEREILDCCREGYDLGLRTFVLQGGEDPGFSPEGIACLVSAIKEQCPGCAVTLSVGEYSREVYALWRQAGVDRYLLRHETAAPDHYRILHPQRQSLDRRLQCLQDLKDLGYQTGCGFMVGSPGQKTEHLVKDLMFLQRFEPHMVGIGPFIPQRDTPFAAYPAGTAEQTLYLLSIVRLLLPQVLLPATTALGTLHPRGRELGMLSGANVCMPNLSPKSARKKYNLYDNKLSDGAEAVESLKALQQRLESVGCRMSLCRGDHVHTNTSYNHCIKNSYQKGNGYHV